MTLLSKDQLATILPQRPPFVMIDTLVADDPAATETSFEILPSTLLVSNGKATAALLVENIAQTAAAGAGFKALQGEGPVLVGFIGAIKNLVIHASREIADSIKPAAPSV